MSPHLFSKRSNSTPFFYRVLETVHIDLSFPRSEKWRFFQENVGGAAIGGVVRPVLFCLMSTLKGQKRHYNTVKLPFSSFPGFFVFVALISRVAANGGV